MHTYKSLLPAYHPALRIYIYQNETPCFKIMNVNFQIMRFVFNEASECEDALPVTMFTVPATFSCYPAIRTGGRNLLII